MMVLRLEPEVVCTVPSCGWLLLKGSLRPDEAGVDLRLHLGDAEDLYRAELPIPVTRKGTIFELVYLPVWCRRVLLRFESGGPQAVAWCLSASPVSRFKRMVLMVRRVLPLFRKQPRRKRLRAGLTIRCLLFDLPNAYRIAGRFRTFTPQMSYQDWLIFFDRLSDDDLRDIRRHLAHMYSPIRFQVLLSLEQAAEEDLSRSLAALSNQIFPVASVLLVHDAVDSSWVKPVLESYPGLACRLVHRDERLTDVLSADAAGAWTVHCRCGDMVAHHALYWIAAELEASTDVRIVYSDDDLMGTDGTRSLPRFKPDWSLELLRSTDYIGPFFAFSSSLLSRSGALKASEVLQDGYGLLLQLVDLLQVGESIRHVPALLYHRLKDHLTTAAGQLRSVRAHLERRNVIAHAEMAFPEVVRVQYQLTSRPLVSIIIPTRDRVDLLRRCLNSVLEKSSYREFELVLVDNCSSEPETLRYIDGLVSSGAARVVRYPAPFNYSAMNNLGAEQAGGKVLCLLNNDTEVISADWLEEMLGHLQQEDVGVVGAKLFYPDGRVQHGGDTVGPGGCAHHLHSFLDRDAPGYCNRAIAAQDLSAVTAACLVTWRSLYEQLGGLDEQNLKIAFNDVDYCLRVREAGFRVVWTPHAQLYHHESASRGKNDAPEKARRSKAEADYMRKKWRHLMECDPYYNVNCSYERPDFSLSNAPMVSRPWER